MGALTSKTYAFTGRAWENNSFESVDILNGFCSAIIVETRGVSVMRVLPKYSREYAAWLPDRIRVIYDAFNYNKISTPYLRYNKGYGNLSWKQTTTFVLISFIYLNLKNLTNIHFELNFKFKVFTFKCLFIKLLRNFGFAFLKKNSFRVFLN